MLVRVWGTVTTEPSRGPLLETHLGELKETQKFLYTRVYGIHGSQKVETTQM